MSRPDGYPGFTLRVEECGCRPVGDGTLPDPIRVQLCARHALLPAEPGWVLKDLCQALGWQGGTIHQVVAEVRRLVAARSLLGEAQAAIHVLATNRQPTEAMIVDANVVRSRILEQLR